MILCVKNFFIPTVLRLFLCSLFSSSSAELIMAWHMILFCKQLTLTWQRSLICNYTCIWFVQVPFWLFFRCNIFYYLCYIVGADVSDFCCNSTEFYCGDSLMIVYTWIQWTFSYVCAYGFDIQWLKLNDVF